MSNEEANQILKELYEVRPEKLNDKAKRLFEAIMKIVDERDSVKADLYEANNRINDLLDTIKLKEEQIEYIENEYEILLKRQEELENQRQNGTLSDGYHTYNDLYYQRCVLFATICNLNKNISWKSKKHNDGKKCFNSDEWFIVGIDTPKGSYTYHYEIKYWDMFEVQELEKGKFWDGHTEKDVTRLLSLIDNYISNDKIKAKIEELDKEEKQKLKGTKGQDRYAIKQEYMYKRSVLQSLLEKE